MSGFEDFSDYDGLGLAGLVRDKKVTPLELVEETIARIERVDPRINAIAAPMYEEARAAAAADLPDGPFRGVPVLVKDLHFAVKGMALAGGSRFFKDYVPDHDAEYVARMRRAGAVLVAKTTTPELGLTPYTEAELYGPTRNPWDLERTCGGSSGGSGAAVGARLAPLAVGADGGGSIRIPASCCGVFGLKPTRGRTPSGPDLGEVWLGLSTAHVLTVSVRDSAAALDATHGLEPGAPYAAPPPARPFLDEVGAPPGRLRIAFSAKPLLGTHVDAEIVSALERTARLLEELGHDVAEAGPEIDRERAARDFLLVVAAEARADIEDGEVLLGRRARPADFEVPDWLFALFGRQYTAVEYARAVRTFRTIGRDLARFFETYDVLLTPTLATPPIPVGSVQPKGAEAAVQKLLARLSAGRVAKLLGGLEASIDKIFAFTPYTPVFNMSGQPAMSVPLEWSAAGLPLGMHFAARFGDEATLFRLAAQLEEARPWRGRRPPVCG